MIGRFAIAMLTLCAATLAEAGPSSFQVPDGYTERDDVLEEQLAALRNTPGVVRGGGRAYQSADRHVVVMALDYTMRLPSRPTWQNLEQHDDAQIADTKQEGDQHLSATRRRGGNTLVADQHDMLSNGGRVWQRRMYAIDATYLMHGFVMMCFMPADRLDECQRILDTMRLTVAGQLAPRDETAKIAPAPRSERSLGHIIGIAAIAALVIGLAAWVAQSARRGGRRRRVR